MPRMHSTDRVLDNFIKECSDYSFPERFGHQRLDSNVAARLHKTLIAAEIYWTFRSINLGKVVFKSTSFSCIMNFLGTIQNLAVLSSSYIQCLFHFLYNYLTIELIGSVYLVRTLHQTYKP